MPGRRKTHLWIAALIVAAVVGVWHPWLAPGVYVFPGVDGPQAAVSIAPARETSLQEFDRGGPSRLAVLLTDESAPFLGLARGLKSIGVPFRITTDWREAVRHRTVLVYPTLSGRVLEREGLSGLADHARSGGTLIAGNVLGGGLEGIFGFADAIPSRHRHVVRFDAHKAQTYGLREKEELEIRLGRGEGEAAFGTYGYTGAATAPVAAYEDGTAAITFRAVGSGRAYAIGFDLGTILSTAYNNREEGIARSYANGFEPAADVLLRFVKEAYRLGEPAAATLGTVPYGKRLAVSITHDVDYTRSLDNAIAYAEYERSAGLPATYFVQTKYVRDWNDDIILNARTAPTLARLRALGMEVASHSVAHAHAFKTFPLGNGAERYPDYRPFVHDKNRATGGTILGELRVSKFLIEQLGGSGHVASFRPGHLLNPYGLPQALDAVGIRFSSSVTANNSLSHLPFRLTHGRGVSAGLPVFEFPVTLEDEAAPPLRERLPQALDLARKIAAYGGSFVLLIHPDVVEPKLGFERSFVEAVKPMAWFGTIEELGSWWAARDQVEIDVAAEADGRIVVDIEAPAAVEGLTIAVPETWQLAVAPSDNPLASRTPDGVVLKSFSGKARVAFAARPGT